MIKNEENICRYIYDIDMDMIFMICYMTRCDAWDIMWFDVILATLNNPANFKGDHYNEDRYYED